MHTRREQVLKSVVQTYVVSAMPVASEALAARYSLGVSSATIRNDLAWLEEAGYLVRPHHSAGVVPSDKGYRFYVESLGADLAPSEEERVRVRHQFHQVEREMEAWGRLAAAILADMARNLALATLPKARRSRFQHLELVFVQDSVALLVLVLNGTRVRQQLLHLEKPQGKPELHVLSEGLNLGFAGLTASEILAAVATWPLVGEQVRHAVVSLMEDEDAREFERPYLEGFGLILGQPEFAQGAEAARVVAAVEGGVLRGFILRALDQGEVQVIIGSETGERALEECSLVLSPYGESGGLRGALAVVGPVRMNYDRAIASVRLVSQMLGELVYELKR